MDSTFNCVTKVLHAEFKSNDGASMPSAAAMGHATPGDTMAGYEPPLMTMPMSRGASPARASAMRAARAPVSASVWSDASLLLRGSLFLVARI